LTQAHPALDPRTPYPVLGLAEPEGYTWIGGDGIGDPFLNPGRRCVFADHFEIVEESRHLTEKQAHYTEAEDNDNETSDEKDRKALRP
jgi:hypothetical protein